jgi:hypothetical protein
MGTPNRGPAWSDHGQNKGKGRIGVRVVFPPQQRSMNRLTGVMTGAADPRRDGYAVVM